MPHQQDFTLIFSHEHYQSATRKERLLAEMRTDPETFTVKVSSNSIDVEKRTDEIAQALEEFPDLREMMDRLGKRL